MIDYKLKGENYGIYIVGDSLTLRWLHSAIHDLADNCFCKSIMDEDGGIYAFAFNVRRALQHEMKKYPASLDPEVPTRYGFDLPWPLLLYWVKILQESVLRQNPDKLTRSIIYQLEAIVELAIDEHFKGDSERVKDIWQRMDVTTSFCHDVSFTRVNYYSDASSKDRKVNFFDVIESFNFSWCYSYKKSSMEYKLSHLNPAIFDLPQYSRYS
jgi:hypothetical protein